MSGELSQGERAVTNAPHHNPVDRRRFETPVSIRRVNGVLGRDRYRYLRLSPLTRHLADRRSPRRSPVLDTTPPAQFLVSLVFVGRRCRCSLDTPCCLPTAGAWARARRPFGRRHRIRQSSTQSYALERAAGSIPLGSALQFVRIP